MRSLAALSHFYFSCPFFILRIDIFYYITLHYFTHIFYNNGHESSNSNYPSPNLNLEQTKKAATFCKAQNTISPKNRHVTRYESTRNPSYVFIADVPVKYSPLEPSKPSCVAGERNFRIFLRAAPSFLAFYKRDSEKRREFMSPWKDK